jgi:hypothetical protein
VKDELADFRVRLALESLIQSLQLRHTIELARDSVVAQRSICHATHLV